MVRWVKEVIGMVGQRNDGDVVGQRSNGALGQRGNRYGGVVGQRSSSDCDLVGQRVKRDGDVLGERDQWECWDE